tara:strand:+ start:98 stop:346 length:249 start_codon:yes stop_codon:yes gene_type:complete
MASHIIDWILEVTCKRRNWRINHGQRKNWKNAIQVYVCKVCDKVYQEVLSLSKKRKKDVLIYEDFPRYKLEKRKCYDCERED